MNSYHLAALGAAFCWAWGGFLATGPNAHLGAIAFTRLRMSIVLVFLAAIVVIRNDYAVISDYIPIIALSGFIGIFLGDIVKFMALGRIGPRRTAMLFATNGPIGAALSFFYLGEIMTPITILGCVSVVTGVVIAVHFGKKNQTNVYEKTKGSLPLAVGLGIFAAICQAIGAILAKPALVAGADLFVVSSIRVGVAVIALSLLLLLPFPRLSTGNKITPRIFWITALGGILSMGIGMSLLLYAISGSNIGVATTLASTTLIFLLGILWAKTKERPTNGALVAVAFVVVGTSIISLF